MVIIKDNHGNLLAVLGDKPHRLSNDIHIGQEGEITVVTVKTVVVRDDLD